MLNYTYAALREHFPQASVFAAPTEFTVPTGSAVEVLKHNWSTAMQARAMQSSELRSQLRSMGNARGLTDYGHDRLQAFASALRLQFRSISWDQITCQGFAEFNESHGDDFMRVDLSIRDDVGVASCSCMEKLQIEGHCHHVLAVVATLKTYGLNAAKFTPFNFGNWIDQLLCDTEKEI